MEHKKNFYIGVILGVIFIGCVIFFGQKVQKSPIAAKITSELALTPTDSERDISLKRDAIVQRVKNGDPLTADDKKILIDILTGSKILGYHFTRAEQEVIVQAINKP